MNVRQDQIDHIQKLTRIGIALSAEKDLDEFFQLVLEEAISYTNADAGSLYMISADKRFLDFQLVCTRSKNIMLGRADTAKWPSVPLYDDHGNKILKNFVSYVVHTGKTANIDDVYDQNIFDNSGTKKYDASNQYRCKSMLGVPLMNHEQNILGVIQLINALDDNNKIISFNQEHIAMLSSLASQAAIALTNKELIEDLERLLYQFIKSIANAIDHKSKYTGGHITRVTTLTEMISRQINRDDKFFPEVNFSENELQEISLSGWMHDMGKITTPEHIMDKATKLETIFDRIELIHTRYELIKALIEKDILCCNDINKNRQKKDLESQIRQLEDDWQFIRSINSGKNMLQTVDLERIEKISQFAFHTDGREFYLINSNEKKNLMIRIGTLLPEEKEKMMEHARITHEMLSALTFPKKFRNVPLYASSHHEKLNGKGYPFGLKSDEMPLPARIIAVADIFESLTAADRPYKDGKTLSDTLKILAFWVRDGELDARIIDLLLETKLYLIYAREFLQPEQIDEIDNNKIRAIYSK